MFGGQIKLTWTLENVEEEDTMRQHWKLYLAKNILFPDTYVWYSVKPGSIEKGNQN